MGGCDEMLGLKKLDKALGTKPADGALSARPVQLGEVMTEVSQCRGRNRLQRTPGAVCPRHELRGTRESTADALMAIPALRKPVGEPIQIGARGSCVVRCPGRRTGKIGREHTALLPCVGWKDGSNMLSPSA